MSLDVTLSKIIVDGNTFDYGSFSPDGALASPTTTFGYDWCIFNSGDFIITNNCFSGMNANGTMIQLSGTATITDNTFIRNTTTISSYINNSGSNDFIVTGNIFDNPTVDGTNENIVVGFTSSSIFEQNINQTAYMGIHKVAYKTFQQISPQPNAAFGEYAAYSGNAGMFNTVGPSGGPEGIGAYYPVPFVNLPGGFNVVPGSGTVTCNFTIGGTLNLNGFQIKFDNIDTYYAITGALVSGGGVVTQLAIAPNFEGLQNSSASGTLYATTGHTMSEIGLTPSSATVGASITTDLNNILPANVRVLSVAVGMYLITNPAAISGGLYALAALTSNPADYQLTSLANTMVDVKNFVNEDGGSYGGSIVIGSGGGQTPPTSFSSATQYLTIDLTAVAPGDQVLFTTGVNRKVLINFRADLSIISGQSAGITAMQESPLVVKFRW
jgi:hypothetical protein